MSVSYAVDFAVAAPLGPDETMVVAAASAFSQCHLNNKASAARCTARSSAWPRWSSRCRAPGSRSGCSAQPAGPDPLTTMARPLVGAATVYFLLNTGLVADGDRAVVAASASATTWHTNFLWSAPSYFVGAGTAALAAWLDRRTPATGWRR